MNEKSVINAFLGLTAQDIGPFIPKEVFVFVSDGDRVFLVHTPAKAEITEIPQCRDEWDKYQKKSSEAFEEYRASGLNNEKAFQEHVRYEEEGFEAYHYCYVREAKNQQYFALLKNQVQLIVDRLLGAGINNTVENFDEFLIRFYSDPDFQKSRIAQPLEGKILEWHETEDMEVVTSTWQEGEPEIISDYEAIKSEIENVKHDISKTENSVIEKIYIENSGFFMDREFRLIDGKWYLCKYDISNL